MCVCHWGLAGVRLDFSVLPVCLCARVPLCLRPDACANVTRPSNAAAAAAAAATAYLGLNGTPTGSQPTRQASSLEREP